MMDAFEPKVEGTHGGPETNLPETGNPQSAICSPQSINPQSAIRNPQSENPQSQSPNPQSENPQSAIRNPRFAIPVIAILILAFSAGIGGLFYDPAAPTK